MVAGQHRRCREAGGDQLPEGAQPFHALALFVAGDDGGVDGADGDARHPVGNDVVGGQRFVGAGLIGAQRPAALEDQDGLFRVCTLVHG